MKEEILFNRFQILKEIHSSSNSKIFLVYDKNPQSKDSDKQIILKVFRENSKPSFRKHEIEILKDLHEDSNEFVPKYISHDLDNKDIPKWLALEYFDGFEPLEKKRNQISKLNVNEKITFFQIILEAYSSFAFVIHKDISPKNILVSEDLKKVKIIDFGASQHTGSGIEERTGAWEAINQYTGIYISPEEQNKHDIDTYTDVYKLGLLFLQILTSFGQFITLKKKNVFIPINNSLR